MFFTVGLFFALDLLLGRPLHETITELPIGDELRDSILDHTGIAGEALRCTLSYEMCEWPDVQFMKLDELAIRGAFVEVSAWSFSVSEEFTNTTT
jgi:EAL and modified HD-GYP domain-containing signal transduction protein